MSADRSQDLLPTLSRHRGFERRSATANEEEDFIGSQEARLSREIKGLRHDDERLVDLLAGLPPAQRLMARVVVIRLLGSARGARLCSEALESEHQSGIASAFSSQSELCVSECDEPFSAAENEHTGAHVFDDGTAALIKESEAPAEESADEVQAVYSAPAIVAAEQQFAASIATPAALTRWQELSHGEPLPEGARRAWSLRLGVELPSVWIHSDRFARMFLDGQGAEALNFGTRVFVDPSSTTPGLLAHELTHVAQRQVRGPQASVEQLEWEARSVQDGTMNPRSPARRLSATDARPLAHPALRALLRAGRWLAKRATRSVSKHIARHGRMLAGRAVHTVFRNPRAIRGLLQSSVREATAILRAATQHGANEVIEQGGFRIFREAVRNVPGKFRYVVQRTFRNPIGTKGERILRIVIDESGRIVSAFPTDRLLALGGGAVALNALTEGTASASERVRERVQADQLAREQRPTDWIGEAIDFFNPLSGGGVLNEGEELTLATEQIIRDVSASVIREIETEEQLSLSAEQRAEISEMVRASVGTSLEAESDEEE